MSEGGPDRKSFLLRVLLLHVLVPFLWEELNCFEARKNGVRARLSSQPVGLFFGRQGRRGRGERLCRKDPEPLSPFQSQAVLASRPRRTKSPVCLGSKCLTVSRCGQSTTCKDDAHSPGLCAREHATHSPDTGHIEVQARTTHARSHTRIDTTHMPHAFTHTEASRLYSPVPGDTATFRFSTVLYFIF